MNCIFKQIIGSLTDTFVFVLCDSSQFHSFHSCIIPTPHDYAYFEQNDWLEKKFYTSINSMSRNLGTIFLPQAPKIYSNVDKNTILMTKLEL